VLLAERECSYISSSQQQLVEMCACEQAACRLREPSRRTEFPDSLDGIFIDLAVDRAWGATVTSNEHPSWITRLVQSSMRIGAGKAFLIVLVVLSVNVRPAFAQDTFCSGQTQCQLTAQSQGYVHQETWTNRDNCWQAE
jgi:hypothetical protein